MEQHHAEHRDAGRQDGGGFIGCRIVSERADEDACEDRRNHAAVCAELVARTGDSRSHPEQQHQASGIVVAFELKMTVQKRISPKSRWQTLTEMASTCRYSGIPGFWRKIEPPDWSRRFIGRSKGEASTCPRSQPGGRSPRPDRWAS